MRELCERLKAAILAAIPTDNLVLCYLPIYGSSPTITDRVSSLNNGTFTNPGWKTLKSGLVVPSFDGTAYIKNSTADWRSGDSQGAIGVWFKTSSATDQALFTSADEATSQYSLRFFVRDTGVLSVYQRSGLSATRDYLSGNTAVADGKWHLGWLVSDGSAYSLFADDGAAETLTIVLGSNTGDWLADTPDRDNISVGALIMDSEAVYLTGELGGAVVYSEAPSLAERQRMYKRLKGIIA